MKTVIAFAILIAGISAMPQPEEYPVELTDQRDIVSSNIVKAIEAASQAIRDKGLDPLYIEKKEYSYALPVPTLFNAAAVVEDLLLSGLSYIVVRKMNYAVVSSRLTFEIELPLIHLSVEKANAEATLFSNKLEIKTSGTVDVRSIRVSGQVRVNIGVISGITIRNIEISFSLGSIDADVNVAVQNKDYSDNVNSFLNKTIPETLTEFSDEINELIEIVLLNVINANLNRSSLI